MEIDTPSNLMKKKKKKGKDILTVFVFLDDTNGHI